MGRYRVRKMIQETGALIQVGDGEGQNEGHELPEVRLGRTITDTKVPGLGDCGVCEETKEG